MTDISACLRLDRRYSIKVQVLSENCVGRNVAFLNTHWFSDWPRQKTVDLSDIGSFHYGHMEGWQMKIRNSIQPFCFKFSCSSHLNLVLVWISLRVLIELFREQPLIFLNQVSPVHHHHPLQPPRKTGKSKTEKKTKTWKYSGQSDVKGAFNIFYIS